MKAKQLIKILETMNPEAEVRLTNGFTGESTTDIAFSEVNDQIILVEA